MEISVIDASNYFKGLLLLIRKDHKVTDPEAAMISRIGKQLGFEREFCETAIREIITNKYIEDDPPLFSSRELAMMFVKDSLAVALSDGILDYKEEKWLRTVVDRNQLSRRWFVRELENAASQRRNVDHLEADGLTVMYTV
jgi:tellurite resistance protein